MAGSGPETREGTVVGKLGLNLKHGPADERASDVACSCVHRICSALQEHAGVAVRSIAMYYAT